MSGAEALSNRRFCAKNGIMSAIAGTLTALGVSIGTEPNAANRVGFYADLPPLSTRLVVVVEGTEVGHFSFDRLEIVQDIYAGNDLSASKGFSQTQTLGVNQTIANDVSNTVAIGDGLSITGTNPSANNVVIGRNTGVQNTTNPGGVVAIGANAYTNWGSLVLIGAGAGADRSFGVTVGRNTYGGGQGNVVIGDNAMGGSVTQQDAVTIGRWSFLGGERAIVVGAYAGSDGVGGVALGESAYVDSLYGIALGNFSYAATDYSVAIGYDAVTSVAGQILLGTEVNYDHVYIPMSTASVDPTSGALQVAGGVGIAGKLNGNGFLFTNESSTLHFDGGELVFTPAGVSDDFLITRGGHSIRSTTSGNFTAWTLTRVGSLVLGYSSQDVRGVIRSSTRLVLQTDGSNDRLVIPLNNAGGNGGMVHVVDGTPNVVFGYDNVSFASRSNFGSSNNSQVSGYFSAESAGNSGRRTGLHGRAYRSGGLGSNQVMLGVIGHASAADDNGNGLLIGVYGQADRTDNTSSTPFGDLPIPRAIGVYARSNGDRATVVNIGVYGVAANSGVANYAGFFEGAVRIGDDDYYYFGDMDTDGSWRVGRSGTDLIYQRLEAAVWVTKQTIAA